MGIRQGEEQGPVLGMVQSRCHDAPEGAREKPDVFFGLILVAELARRIRYGILASRASL